MKCVACRRDVEPCTEVELLPDARSASDLCRACWTEAIEEGPLEDHVCPECRGTWACWGEPCGGAEVLLCRDCDKGRTRDDALRAATRLDG